MSNLRMLAFKTVLIKDLPFGADNLVDEFTVNLPIEFSGGGVEFKFTAQFKRQLPESAICQSLREDRGYMLSTGALFSQEFANNHAKALDDPHIYCSITNLTQKESGLKRQERRLFFNREYLNLGLIYIRVHDQIEVKFFEVDKDAEVKDNEPFSLYIFKITSDSFE